MIEVQGASVLHAATALSTRYREETDDDHKKAWGQFFTSARIAEFMAGFFSVPNQSSVRILDPGAGTGVLGLAAAKSLLDSFDGDVHLVAVEKESGARAGLHASLLNAGNTWKDRFSFEVLGDDFLDLDQPRIGRASLSRFHYVIGNPPYFKMSPSDLRGGDAPNAYARFLEVSMRMLEPEGQLCFIIPRSFAAGYYFRRFRQRLHASARLDHVHIFDSRRDAFREDDVLQENIVVFYRKTNQTTPTVEITSSHGERDLDARSKLVVSRNRVVAPNDRDAVISLPTTPRDIKIMDLVHSWPHSLGSLGLDVSTGPIVPFRAEHLLRANTDEDTVPMLWLQHVGRGHVTWPLGPGFRKPENIAQGAGPKLLVPNKTYVLLRRFSAKEDERRIIAAPYLQGALDAPSIGLENHVNFIHRPKSEMGKMEAIGLAALLNSSLVDAFFRISSGNTQVSATELRSMPLPSADILLRLAQKVSDSNVDDAVVEVFGET